VERTAWVPHDARRATPIDLESKLPLAGHFIKEGLTRTT
jgi:hypothetical protein